MPFISFSIPGKIPQGFWHKAQWYLVLSPLLPSSMGCSSGFTSVIFCFLIYNIEIIEGLLVCEVCDVYMKNAYQRYSRDLKKIRSYIEGYIKGKNKKKTEHHKCYGRNISGLAYEDTKHDAWHLERSQQIHQWFFLMKNSMESQRRGEHGRRVKYTF